MRSLAIIIGLAACSYHAPDAPSSDGTPAPDDVATIDIAPTGCPVGYEAIVGAPSKYKLGAAPASYTAAVSDCKSPNTHLVRIDTQAEIDAIKPLANNLIRVVATRHKNNPIDQNDDQWMDLDDATELTFLPWGIGEPTNGNSELCMVIRTEAGTGQVVSGAHVCDVALPYVCECE